MMGLTGAVCSLHVPIADVKIYPSAEQQPVCKPTPTRFRTALLDISAQPPPQAAHLRDGGFVAIGIRRFDDADDVHRCGVRETNYFRLQHDFKERDIIGMDNTDPESIN